MALHRITLVIDFHDGDPALPGVPYTRFVNVSEDADAHAVVELLLREALKWDDLLFPPSDDRAFVSVRIEAADGLDVPEGYGPIAYDLFAVRKGLTLLDVRHGVKALRALERALHDGRARFDRADDETQDDYVRDRISARMDHLRWLQEIGPDYDQDTRIVSAWFGVKHAMGDIQGDIAAGRLVLTGTAEGAALASEIERLSELSRVVGRRFESVPEDRRIGRIAGPRQESWSEKVAEIPPLPPRANEPFP